MNVTFYYIYTNQKFSIHILKTKTMRFQKKKNDWILLPLLKVDMDGKSEGLLQMGDYILAVNGMAPESLSEGEQLVKDAFRTLTLTVWR